MMAARAYQATEVARIVGGAVLAEAGAEPTGGPAAAIDSRLIEGGEVFFALPGERTDGHRFLTEALRKGASLFVVAESHADKIAADLPRERTIAVNDPADALVRLARHHRLRFVVSLIAVTGSNGKTTVKELLASIFRTAGPTLASRVNYNTLLGLALTLLRLEEEHRWAVVEVGISAPGEMIALAELVRPLRRAVFTNVHAAHLEELGSVRHVAQEKVRLATAMTEGGTIHVNGDDAPLMHEIRALELQPRTFGRSPRCDLRPESVEPWREEGIRLVLPDGVAFEAPLYGEHNVYNLLAAIDAARTAGLGDETIARGLAAFRPPPGRFHPERIGGVLLIDDTYNANLASTLGAIAFLHHREGPGRRFLLFGDMFELGTREEADHREVGRAAARAGLDRLWLVGSRTAWTAEAAAEAGLDEGRIIADGRDRAALVDQIAATLAPGDCLVAKGSRAMRMEEILHAVRERLAAETAEGRR